jgi:hypothetical protein
LGEELDEGPQIGVIWTFFTPEVVLHGDGEGFEEVEGRLLFEEDAQGVIGCCRVGHKISREDIHELLGTEQAKEEKGRR